MKLILCGFFITLGPNDTIISQADETISNASVCFECVLGGTSAGVNKQLSSHPDKPTTEIESEFPSPKSQPLLSPAR